MIEVYPSLLCKQMSDNVDLYIKLKLGDFSTYLTHFSTKVTGIFKTCSEGLNAGKHVSDVLFKS